MDSIQSLYCISEHLSMAECNVFYLCRHLSVITVYSVLPLTFFWFLYKKDIRKITLENLYYYNSLGSQFGIFLILQEESIKFIMMDEQQISLCSPWALIQSQINTCCSFLFHLTWSHFSCFSSCSCLTISFSMPLQYLLLAFFLYLLFSFL